MAVQQRNRTLDFIRILLASMVLLGHAYELRVATTSQEPLLRLSRGGAEFGEVAVDFFFLLSGSLILASWIFDPRWSDFIKKRCLRILPGYVVAVVIAIVVCGLLAPGVPHFFRAFAEPPHSRMSFTTFISLDSPHTPPVFPGTDYPLVDGSMWTLGYEARCYLLVALWGVLGLLKSRKAWTLTTIASAVAFHFQGWMALHRPKHLGWLIGQPEYIGRLFFPFLVGGCFFLYRKELSFRPVLAALAALGLVASMALHLDTEFFLILFGGYLLFYAARFHTPNEGLYTRVPDISYGMYIYGWPIEKLCLWYLHTSPIVTFLVSFIAAADGGAKLALR